MERGAATGSCHRQRGARIPSGADNSGRIEKRPEREPRAINDTQACHVALPNRRLRPSDSSLIGTDSHHAGNHRLATWITPGTGTKTSFQTSLVCRIPLAICRRCSSVRPGEARREITCKPMLPHRLFTRSGSRYQGECRSARSTYGVRFPD